MSQVNVQFVQQALAHFTVAGEPAWDSVHEDVEVHDHDILDAGEYRGHAGFARWLKDWAAAWSNYTMEPEEFLDAGDRVVACILQKTTGHGSGVMLERHDAMVVEVRGGKIMRVDYYNDKAQALRAAGLTE